MTGLTTLPPTISSQRQNTRSEEFFSFVDQFYQLLENFTQTSSEKACLSELFQQFFSTRDRPMTLEQLRSIYSLSQEEWLLLFLCTTLEVRPKFSWLYTQIGHHFNEQGMTIDFASHLADLSFYPCLSHQSPLFRESLLLIDKRSHIVQAPLRVAEHILCYLTGIPFVDVKILPLLQPIDSSLLDEELPSSQKEVLAEVVQHLIEHARTNARPLLQLLGEDETGKKRVVLQACHQQSRPLHLLEGQLLPEAFSELHQLVRLMRAQALLYQDVYVVDFQSSDHTESSETKKRLFSLYAARYLRGSCILLSHQSLPAIRESSINFFVQQPSLEEKIAEWKKTLSFLGTMQVEHLGNLVEQFDLSQNNLRTIAASLQKRAQTTRSNEKDFYEYLWQLCREHTRLHLNESGQCLESKLTWEDIVLSDYQREVLENIVSHVRQRYQVYRKWGFADKENRGLGIVALFCGPSGTGKTMSAEVIANALHLDLYRINLSKVVSKYIGETQKNLEEIFISAEKSCAILLFDEADSIFGKRSQIKESRDRYANMEVNYLLQRLENYRGLSILTTNLKSNIDTAFFRRFRFILEFQYPTQEQREALWRSFFTDKVPKEEIDFEQLSKLTLSGANIKSIVLNAAFQASAQNRPVTMAHVQRAAELEHLKLEKPLSISERRMV